MHADRCVTEAQLDTVGAREWRDGRVGVGECTAPLPRRTGGDTGVGRELCSLSLVHGQLRIRVELVARV